MKLYIIIFFTGSSSSSKPPVYISCVVSSCLLYFYTNGKTIKSSELVAVTAGILRINSFSYALDITFFIKRSIRSLVYYSPSN